MANPDYENPRKIPCPQWLRGECPAPKSPEKDCHLWKSGECRPGLKGDCLNQIREGEKQFGKVMTPPQDPYLNAINYLSNDGGMRPDAGHDSGLMAHPALSESPYTDGAPSNDNANTVDNAKAVQAAEEAYRLQHVLTPRPSFNPKPGQSHP